MLLQAGQRLQRRVTIRLQTMTKGDRVVMTDDYGNFAFRGLMSGDYTIVIDKEKDFQPFSQIGHHHSATRFPAAELQSEYSIGVEGKN